MPPMTTTTTPNMATPTHAGGNLTAFIDQGSEFEGKLTFRDTVRIDGVFRGEISSENTLVVGETGEVQATVRSRSVIVSGTVTGNIQATQQLVLHKTARVEGDLEAASVAIEEGALFNGRIKMAGGEPRRGGEGKRPPMDAAGRPLEALPGGKNQS